MSKYTSKRKHGKRSRGKRSNRKTRRNGSKMNGGGGRVLTVDEFKSNFIATRVKFVYNNVYNLYVNHTSNTLTEISFDFTVSTMSKITYNMNKKEVWKGIVEILGLSSNFLALEILSDKKKNITTAILSNYDIYSNKSKNNTESYKKADAYLNYDRATRIIIIGTLETTDLQKVANYLTAKGIGISSREVDKLFDVIESSMSALTGKKAVDYINTLTKKILLPIDNSNDDLKM